MKEELRKILSIKPGFSTRRMELLEAFIEQEKFETQKEWAAMIAKKFRELPADKASDPKFVELWLDSFHEFKIGAPSEKT